METLLLHWNQIRSKGALALAKAIKNSNLIKILDLSFNSMGSGCIRRAIINTDLKREEEVVLEQRHKLKDFECSESAWKWRKTFLKNRSLLHVDIGFNGFTPEDMTAIGDGLR